MELITFFLAVIETFLPRYDAKEIWLDHTVSLIASLIFILQAAVFCAIIYSEFLFCLVSDVFSGRRY